MREISSKETIIEQHTINLGWTCYKNDRKLTTQTGQHQKGEYPVDRESPGKVSLRKP